MTNKEFGDRVRAGRRRMGLRVEDLAKLVGVNRSGVYKMQRGERQPRGESLRRLAEALDDPGLAMTEDTERRLDEAGLTLLRSYCERILAGAPPREAVEVLLPRAVPQKDDLKVLEEAVPGINEDLRRLSGGRWESLATVTRQALVELSLLRAAGSRKDADE